jgi:hypothetical protein
VVLLRGWGGGQDARPSSSTLQGESSAFASEVPDEERHGEHYGREDAAILAGREPGALTRTVEPDLLNVLLLSLAVSWAALPQVVRMITGATTGAEEDTRRRASVVEAVRRRAGPAAGPPAWPRPPSPAGPSGGTVPPSCLMAWCSSTTTT